MSSTAAAVTAVNISVFGTEIPFVDVGVKRFGADFSFLYFILGHWAVTFLAAAFGLVLSILGGQFSNAVHRFGMETAKNPMTEGAVRAQWAQANSWEAFLPFSIAILACAITNVNPAVVHAYSWMVLLTRAVYIVVYVAQVGNLAEMVSFVRSGVWFVNTMLTVQLLVFAAEAHGAK
eukprot:Clim_evm29s231 gene=Clim_evmTU29s231